MTCLFIFCLLTTSVGGIWIYGSVYLTVIGSVLEKFTCVYFKGVSAYFGHYLHVCKHCKSLRNTTWLLYSGLYNSASILDFLRMLLLMYLPHLTPVNPRVYYSNFCCLACL